MIGPLSRPCQACCLRMSSHIRRSHRGYLISYRLATRKLHPDPDKLPPRCSTRTSPNRFFFHTRNLPQHFMRLSVKESPVGSYRSQNLITTLRRPSSSWLICHQNKCLRQSVLITAVNLLLLQLTEILLQTKSTTKNQSGTS
ncbi:hypothetical protein XENOCAPTIV_025656 [Xenoophorus captivus]|uniref:Uncharacterized protein n=1 Tax=Xenoophorus captivus TaxID=1517983 RepID=A0ABV0R275_9TELE